MHQPVANALSLHPNHGRTVIVGKMPRTTSSLSLFRSEDSKMNEWKSNYDKITQEGPYVAPFGELSKREGVRTDVPEKTRSSPASSEYLKFEFRRVLKMNSEFPIGPEKKLGVPPSSENEL